MAAERVGEIADGFSSWLKAFLENYVELTDSQKNATIDQMIACSGVPQLSHLCAQIETLFFRDFVKFLPPELQDHLLTFLDGQTLLKCCCVCKTWNKIVSSSSVAWHNACHLLGMKINKESQKQGAVYWKSFYLEMKERYDQMKTCHSFTSQVYDKHLRRVTAVCYYKGKLAAASDSKVINIWDCSSDECVFSVRTDASICAIKFDENFLIASSYLGHMMSWNVETGQNLVEYMRHLGVVFTFDYCPSLDIIISGAADCKIKLWSFSSGQLYHTLRDHGFWVLKVILNKYPDEKGRHLIFTLDKTKIIVRFLTFGSSECRSEASYIASIISHYHIPLNNGDLRFYTPGLYFDGIYLYFICQLPKLSNRSVLYKWDIYRQKLASEIIINEHVKAFLGAGSKYVAIVTPWKSSTNASFVVLDKNTWEKVASWHLPPIRPTSPNFFQLALGDKDWLNGLDGKNDKGVMLGAGLDNNCVYVVKWNPRRAKVVS